MIPWLLALALARDPDPSGDGAEPPPAADEEAPVRLPAGEDALGDVHAAWEAQARDPWSAHNFLRPALGVVVHDRIRPASLGVRAGRRWWQLRDGLAAALAVEADADFALARGRGSHDLAVRVLGGPWLGPFGLAVGPGAGHSRWVLGPASLAPATGLDAHAALVADLTVLHLFAGAAPRWLVATDRPPAWHNPLGLGDELWLRAGAGASLGGVRLGLTWGRWFTAVGPIDRYALNLRFQLL